jgi:glycosyltransferase involved in cell wall biosynthesis
MFLSVLVNAYNRAYHLDRVLHAYRRQTHRDFEVVVADDGSTDGTRDVAERHARESFFPVRFVTQPHEGHRRAAILNRGILDCRARVILFTDCDALPRANLLEMHARHFSPRRMMIGGRVRLLPEETEAVTTEVAERGDYEALLTPARQARLRREHLKNVFQIATRRRRRPHNLGLNFSIERESLFSVNGYDENYRGWGNADGDLRERLKKIGVWPKSIWTRAVVFHMHHEEDPTRKERRNVEYSRRSGIPVFCENGLFRPPARDAAGPVGSGQGAGPGAGPRAE